MNKAFAIFATLILLGGCAAYTLVEAKRQKIGSAYSVQTSIQWSKLTADNLEVWTVDGPDLELIRFYRDLADGDRLLKAPDDKKLPTYKPAMSASEVMEFVVDTFARSDASNVTATGLRPARFGAASGFRFDFSFASSEGLWFDGMAAGAIVDGKLHLIIYSGTRQYYFPKYKDEVERIMGSVETT